jgi:hypothetical protein
MLEKKCHGKVRLQSPATSNPTPPRRRPWDADSPQSSVTPFVPRQASWKLNSLGSPSGRNQICEIEDSEDEHDVSHAKEGESSSNPFVAPQIAVTSDVEETTETKNGRNSSVRRSKRVKLTDIALQKLENK